MYNDLARYYDLVFPFSKTEGRFLDQFISKGQKALDLGTGTGKTAVYLSTKGLNVVALDLSEEMIKIARAKQTSVNFMVGDMLSFLKSTTETFDIITCFGNTLAHLRNEELDVFFNLARKRLSAKGVLLVQLLNYDRILKTRPSVLPQIIKDGITFQRHYTYLENNIVFTTRIIKEDKEVYASSVTLYPHVKAILQETIEAQSFNSVVYGQFDAKPWSIGTSHITIVATPDNVI